MIQFKISLILAIKGSVKAFYCEFETDYKENSYFNVLAAGEKNQAMRYCKRSIIW